MEYPENYKLEYRNRVYYPNRCNLCFSNKNLMKCGSCLAVSYCSKDHQTSDWSFHKPTCTALKKLKEIVPLPRPCDSKMFFEYRKKLRFELAILRRLDDPFFLTDYEQQVCMLPWVCLVCFVTPKLKFECSKCESVVYCSIEHMRMDRENHIPSCWPWTYCRVVNSMHYECGFKISKPYIYKPIPRSLDWWPDTKAQLCRLLINRPCPSHDATEYISKVAFTDPYIPAAIIINALEMIGYIEKRIYVRNWQSESKPPKKKATNKSKSLLKKGIMTVHFAVADEYELGFSWNEIAKFLTDWMLNLDKVRIVLTGRNLEYCTIPKFGNSKKVEVIVHQKAYQKVDNLPKPDVVILLEYFRVFLRQNRNITEHQKFLKAVFKYRDVPVIICDGRPDVLRGAYESLLRKPDIACILPMQRNLYPELRMVRVWNEDCSTFTRNAHYCIFMKDEYF